MKEITRIHIAKVPYDIETSAKHAIETYIQNLKAYANDEELLQDIEIRITEILGERGVQANGVITDADVKAVREQLGEPKDFMGDDGEVVGPGVELSGEPTRRLYRSTDNAVLGGVLSGIANFFKINPIWTRLIFLILLLGSFGTVFLLYVVLWIALPPAKTAAEKLQMSGWPVTLESIRDLNARETKLAPEYDSARAVRRVLRVLAGTLSVIVAVGTVIATVAAAIAISHENVVGDYLGGEAAYVLAYVLAIISGVLLASLFTLISYAFFAAKLPKRLVVSGIGVIVAGMLTFGSAAGIVAYGGWQNDEWMQRNLVERSISTPAGMNNIKNLTVDSDTLSVEYVVSDQTRVTYSALPQSTVPTITVNGNDMAVTLRDSAKKYWQSMSITVYGPALDSLTSKKGEASYRNDGRQAQLTAIANEDATVRVVNGNYDQLTLRGAGYADASDARVVQAVSLAEGTASHNFATVKNLTVNVPDICANSGKVTVRAMGVTSDQTKINGTDMTGDAYETNCAKVQIGKENFEY